MDGISEKQVAELLDKEFPKVNRELRRAVSIIFDHLRNRLSNVSLGPCLTYLVLVDPDLTRRCLLFLIREDLLAGGNVPIYISANPADGAASSSEGRVEIEFQEWRRS